MNASMEWIEQLARWGWPLLIVPLAMMTGELGATVERALLGLALAAALAGAASLQHRCLLARSALVLLGAAALALVLHLAGDDFGYRYPWLYSAAELPSYLKVANLWGGEEGTLLLMATLLALAACRLADAEGWSGPGALLLAAAFTLGALIWDPFAATPAAEIGTAPRGMNAHLLSPWMALHPPLLFAAYVLVLAPFGGALQALARGEGFWLRRYGTWLRAAWLILSSGLFAGMWWAYEDFSFGQFWHWDPVQTSVFVVWALITAQLHGPGRYHPRGRFGLLLPGLAALGGIAVLLSMVITRSPALASSHRYVGDSSLPLLLAMAGALAALTVWALLAGLRRSRARSPRPAEPTALLMVAIGGLLAAAAIGTWHIGWAYLGAWLGWSRPESLKPFFETLARWAGPAEIAALRSAFEQWDIDRYAMNAALVPVLVALTLAGGHYFAPIGQRIARWLVTAAVLALALLCALVLQPAQALFDGTGMTSSATVAILPWLDALAIGASYLLLAAIAASLLGQGSWRARLWSYRVPVALIHAGLVLALIAGTAATVFDSYAQRMIAYPEDFGGPIRFPDGFELSVTLEEDGVFADGGRGQGFRSIGRIAWQLEREGQIIEAADGHAVYRDERPPLAGEHGPVRLMCEILDYRYARYASDSGQMIHPFIHRGAWRDVQVWLPAVEHGPASDGAAPARRATTVPLVLKVYPLMSWLWAGLALMLAGVAWRLAAQRYEGRSPR
jgi:cytochrome c-type biogenesis protein CcmF